MAEADGRYSWCGTPGSGQYGAGVAKQTALATDVVKDKIFQLVKGIPFVDDGSVFNIGDYGTADGAASMLFIRDMVFFLKELHGPQLQVQVIYEDQETNDFNSLFKRLAGVIPDPPSYLLELDNVYPLASGVELRKQCVPSTSMHFIMSMFAIHWLSKVPVKYKESVYKYPHSSLKEKAALEEEASKDWERFLLQRSIELKQGGVLLVVTGNAKCDDQTDEHTLKTFLLTLNNTWLSFRETGKITNEEFLNTNFPLCWYSLEQLRAPFEDGNSPVSKSGLRLVTSEAFYLECVFFSEWKKKKDRTGDDDREEFARNFVTTHRKWTQFAFEHGLSDSRTQQEKEDIVASLYQIAEKKISEMNPEQMENDRMCSYVIIRKE